MTIQYFGCNLSSQHERNEKDERNHRNEREREMIKTHVTKCGRCISNGSTILVHVMQLDYNVNVYRPNDDRTYTTQLNGKMIVGYTDHIVHNALSCDSHSNHCCTMMTLYTYLYTYFIPARYCSGNSQTLWYSYQWFFSNDTSA